MRIAVAVIGVVLGACQPTIGERVVRFPDGAVRWRVPTQNGFPHGASTTFYSDGTIETTGAYRHGEKTGIWKRFTREGQLIETSTWSDGKLHGEIRRWRADGTFARRLIAVRGEVVFESYVDGDTPSVAELVAKHAAPEPPAPALRPPFATLDRLATGRRVGTQLGFHRLSGGGSGNRLDVHGHGSIGPWLGYGQLAIGQLETQLGRSSSKTTLELGGGWTTALPRVGDLVLRGGFALPLAGDDLEGFTAASALGFERLTDLSATSARSVVGRASASLIGSVNWAFYRADLGLDSAFRDGSLGDDFAAGGTEVFGRLNIGAGIASDSLSGTLEIANVARLVGAMSAERFGHTLALVGRYRQWPVEPSMGVVWPADPSISGVVVLFVGLSSGELGR